jgi:glycosyltransferase involved in cell wall biosynthesis
VYFHGWQPKQALNKFYSKAHFILLPSTTEGWPKVLSEGMAFGVVPLASAVSSIPQVLSESGAGLSLAVEDVCGFAQAIEKFLRDSAAWKRASLAGVVWANRFTYPAYLQNVREMFMDAWNVKL